MPQDSVDRHPDAVTINASVVQGDGVRPSVYDINTTDSIGKHKIAKYADDTYLVVGAEMRGTVLAELEKINNLAMRNYLRLNTNKSQAMLRPIPRGGRWMVLQPHLSTW